MRALLKGVQVVRESDALRPAALALVGKEPDRDVAFPNDMERVDDVLEAKSRGCFAECALLNLSTVERADRVEESAGRRGALLINDCEVPRDGSREGVCEGV